MGINIGILGPEGTFSEDAAGKWIKKPKGKGECTIKYYETIFDISESLIRKNIDYGIVPIENSLEGSVGDTLDVLSTEAEIRIIEEILLNINFCLLAKNIIPLANIKKIVSHPYALAQCKQFIRKKLKCEMKYTESTASAAALAAKNEEIAALASKEAAKKYSLVILKENVQDRDSVTRFVVLALATSESDVITHSSRNKTYKTSILIYLKDKPGALYEVLGEYAKRKINLTKIESRPSKKALGDYMFHIDCEGHIKDKNIKDALKSIEKKVEMLKILGCYPRG